MKGHASLLAALLTLGCGAGPTGGDAPTSAATPPAAVTPTPDEPAQGNDGRPNIVLIYTDDQGFADVGVAGLDSAVHTPQADALAAAGTYFQRAYVSAPQCSPSRAGMLTGQYQGRFGFETNSDGPLRPKAVTIAERLQEAGYRTGMAGKWHLGLDQNNRQNLPADARPAPFRARAQGFDEHFEGYREHWHASHSPEGHALPQGEHQTAFPGDRIALTTRWAEEFIARHADAPFFLYVPYFAPHVPLEATAEDRAVFAGEPDAVRRDALAMIHAMDRGLGTLREALARHELTRRTLIIFASDNGAPELETVRNGSSNGPLIGEKGMLTEGGLRVPFIIAWPGALPAGRVEAHPVSSLDIAPTILGAAGLSRDPLGDGRDLRPWLRGESNPPERRLYWRWMNQAAVRDADWTLLWLGDGRRYLFAAGAPEQPQQDRSAQVPDVAADLTDGVRHWAQSLRPGGLPASGISEMEAHLYTAAGFP